MTFMHWVTLYNNITTNLIGEDRDEAIAAMANDADFDRWLVRYERKNASKSRKSGGGFTMDAEEAAVRFGTVYGGEKKNGE